MKKSTAKVLMIIAFVLIIASLGFAAAANYVVFSPLLIAGLACMSLSFKGYDKLKGFSYTMWIFTAVAVSMSYPQYFLQIGNYKLSGIVTPLLQIIMFGMGSHMSVKDFAGVIKMPKGVIVGLISHYTIMPLAALLWTSLFQFPPEIAAGVILIAVTPSGMASNVMAYLARANVALAVTVTTFSTACAPFLTPLIFHALAPKDLPGINADTLGMFIHIVKVVVFPVIAGLAFNLYYREGEVSDKGRKMQMAAFLLIILLRTFILGPLEISQSDGSYTWNNVFSTFAVETVVFLIAPAVIGFLVRKYNLISHEKLADVLSLLSQLGILLIIVVVTAAGRDDLLKVGLLLLLVMIMQNCFGFALGYSFCRFIMRMPEQDCRAVTMEVGMQNGGMASSLAVQMNGAATIGLAPAIYGPLQNITGSILATYWKNRPIKGQESAE